MVPWSIKASDFVRKKSSGGDRKIINNIDTIPHTPDSFNSLALIAQSLQFWPESDYMKIYGPNFDKYLRSPNMAQEILAIQKSTIPSEQLFQ